jgi:hypothetical protein
MAEETTPGLSNQSVTARTSTGATEKGGRDDVEIKAIYDVVTALTPLTEPQRLRALDYVLRRFDALSLQSPSKLPGAFVPQALSDLPAQGQSHYPSQAVVSSPVQDIRTLKEQKEPSSGIQMAVLVAYYLSETAPAGERKDEITKADIERYFKMAGFSLPADATFTLNNAKNAGYLDSTSSGHYKLNPVGYNLVTHRMGSREVETKGKSGKKSHSRRGAKTNKTSRKK